MNAREGFQHVFHAVATRAENKNGSAFARRNPHFPVIRALLRKRSLPRGFSSAKGFDSIASADKIFAYRLTETTEATRQLSHKRQPPSPAVIGAAQGNSTPAGIGTLCGEGVRRGNNGRDR
jgi:hypothetical protein